MLRNQKGFTLIEIIAVLVILGILAAVAIPRYISLMEQARNNAAQTAIAEVKARASSYYAFYTLSNAGTPTATVVYNWVNANMSLGSDFTGSVSQPGGSSDITISISAVKGNPVSVSGTWTYPQ